MPRTELIRVVFVLDTTRDPTNDELQNVLERLQNLLHNVASATGVKIEEE